MSPTAKLQSRARVRSSEAASAFPWPSALSTDPTQGSAAASSKSTTPSRLCTKSTTPVAHHSTQQSQLASRSGSSPRCSRAPRTNSASQQSRSVLRSGSIAMSTRVNMRRRLVVLPGALAVPLVVVTVRVSVSTATVTTVRTLRSWLLQLPVTTTKRNSSSRRRCRSTRNCKKEKKRYVVVGKRVWNQRFV